MEDLNKNIDSFHFPTVRYIDSKEFTEKFVINNIKNFFCQNLKNESFLVPCTVLSLRFDKEKCQLSEILIEFYYEGRKVEGAVQKDTDVIVRFNKIGDLMLKI